MSRRLAVELADRPNVRSNARRGEPASCLARCIIETMIYTDLSRCQLEMMDRRRRRSSLKYCSDGRADRQPQFADSETCVLSPMSNTNTRAGDALASRDEISPRGKIGDERFSQQSLSGSMRRTISEPAALIQDTAVPRHREKLLRPTRK